MSKLNHVFLLSLVFLLIAGCSDDEIQPMSLDSADDVSQKNAKAKYYVPFKATFEVYIDEITHMPPPLPKVQNVIGNGNATHLGKTQMFMEQKWWPPHAPPLIPPWTGTGVGEIIFTAANGDILLAEYGDATGFHKTENLVILKFTGHFKDGGSGRFANAEGSFEYYGEYIINQNKAIATLNGEIKYHK